MNKKIYSEKFLIFGIVNLLCGFYFFAPTLFTQKKSLTVESGQVENIEIFYRRVSSRGAKSTKSELFIKVKNDSRNYYLMENISQKRRNETFEIIKKKLTISGGVKIWIKKTDINEYEPTIFQISDNKGNILFNVNQAKSHSKTGFIITFLAGIFGVGVFVYQKKKNGHNLS
ncbi:hypothetical protein F7018_14860 [Tenacibaculum aiptasiae]|uniref:DUF3592 domain-containing protein n=1 Tax=Tenacibaculum aiptasiae TaxID=426481 RepID=A0A7J5A9Y8_9FLAO|nr:hypothetical protein [Tenacibaculum aiptasiae]KAB1154248.1 hypothetical protein F7018_14860 [Tenacibaculum aiptasiae]